MKNGLKVYINSVEQKKRMGSSAYQLISNSSVLQYSILFMCAYDIIHLFSFKKVLNSNYWKICCNKSIYVYHLCEYAWMGRQTKSTLGIQSWMNEWIGMEIRMVFHQLSFQIQRFLNCFMLNIYANTISGKCSSVARYISPRILFSMKSIIASSREETNSSLLCIEPNYS